MKLDLIVYSMVPENHNDQDVRVSFDIIKEGKNYHMGWAIPKEYCIPPRVIRELAQLAVDAIIDLHDPLTYKRIDDERKI